MTEVDLPSGAKLRIQPAPFKDSRALYQAILEEAKVLKLDPKTEIDVNLFKDLFCVGVSSKKIESCLWECMKVVRYNELKIDADTFEKVEAREDYLTVCFEVAKENVLPFMKNLYAKYAPMLGVLKSSLP